MKVRVAEGGPIPVQDMACGRSEGDIFSRHQENGIIKKKHVRHRSYSNFHPPLKNVFFTVGAKSISKMAFLRSMGSKKQYASYRAWEAYLSSFATPPQWNDHFFFAIYTAERCQKLQNVLPTLHEKQMKKCFIRSMASVFLIFATPLQ